jgi:hypothetical protein
MATQWRITKVEHLVCAHDLEAVHIEVAYEYGGRPRTLRLDYHLTDLVNMPGELKDNLAHLIDVNLAYRLVLHQSEEKLSDLEGLTGEIEDIETVLQDHPGGWGEDHPPVPEHIDPVVQQ